MKIAKKIEQHFALENRQNSFEKKDFLFLQKSNKITGKVKVVFSPKTAKLNQANGCFCSKMITEINLF